uniref:Lymphocyte cytosolic protein 2 n=1 Tax=Pundamilia nyererei TaxID=303518 RepID=A0A3B4H8T9_9CICH
MSSDRVPSRSDMMGWNPQQLADYLRRMNLSGCDKVVLKHSISGSRFVNLSDNDLQKFPKLHTPMISKLNSEINKKEKRGGFFIKKRPPNTSFSLRFLGQDDEFDDDYESPYSDDDGSGGDYESPNDDQDAGNDYEPPPSEPAEDHKLCPPRPIGDGDYIGTLMSSHTPENITIESSFGSFLTPDAVIEFVSAVYLSAGLYSLTCYLLLLCLLLSCLCCVNKCWCVGACRPPQEDPPTFTKPPLPSTNINRSNSSAHLSPSGAVSFVFAETHTELVIRGFITVRVCVQELDPRWYVGKVTRGQAEGCLKRVRKDGAYLVRDSTRQQANQPFTLMVYYQDKVYNIQIRQQNQQFVLGTGLKVQESFPSVSDIISHYSQSPLLLIDAKNRSASQQNQCCSKCGPQMRPSFP